MDEEQRRLFSTQYEDQDVAIWVCPHGYPFDVIEFAVGTPEPKAKVCGSHGQQFHKQCPNPDCPEPLYHPSDFEQSFHRPCGAKIPWAEDRRAAAQIDYEPFNSKLVGRKKLSDAEKFIRDRYFPSAKSGAPLKEPPVVPPPAGPPSRYELTPQERQDLIVPPSGRATDYSGISPSGVWPKKGIARRRVEGDADQAIYAFATAVTSFQKEKVEKPLQRLVRRVAKFLGASVSKGVENFIAKVVEYVLLAALILLLLRFGFNVSWLQ